MKRLLIAYQSETIADILSEYLKKDYDVYTCTNGNTAIQLLQAITPDALIISLTFPGITGLSVLKQSTYRPPVIIALTNYFSNSILEEAQAVGIKALIRLPCSIDCIVSHLNRLLNK